MKIKPINEFPRRSIDQLLAAIPFYKTVKQQDLWQFELLLQHSRLVYFAPGETVLQYGESDSWLYFLLKGQLAVYVTDQLADAEAVNYITPGEVFGDMAMLLSDQRTATLIVDPSCREVMAFGTDFTVFGELDDFRNITLATKLAYYRNTVHNLRWKLEVYRMKYPDDELAGNHRRVKLYTGPKDGVEELHGLHDQAVQLAELMLQWNRRFGGLTLSEGGTINPQILADME